MEVIVKEAGVRLDKAVADLTELSRSQANEAIKAGTILVNNQRQKARYAVKLGDVISYELPKRKFWIISQKISLSRLSTRTAMSQWSINRKAWWFIRQQGIPAELWSMLFCIMLRTCLLSMVWFAQESCTALIRTLQGS